MKVVLASRMSSSRLPGKALLPMFEEMSMVDVLLHRIRLAKHVTGVVLATSVDQSDDPLESWALNNEVECFRGSLDDVLGRLAGCISQLEMQSFVEILGDNPLVDPDDIDRCILEFTEGGWDYVATATIEYSFAEHENCYPVGVRVQCFKSKLIEDAANLYLDPHSREHSSTFIYGRTSEYRRKLISWPHQHGAVDCNLNFAVNTAADFERNKNLLKQVGLDGSLPDFLSAFSNL